MKTILSILFITILSIHTLKAQTLPAKSYWIETDNYGRKVNTGVVKERYGEDSDGNIHGKYISYFSNGVKEKVIDYVHGKIEGKYEEYYSDGDLKAKLLYKNGALDGLCYIVDCIGLFGISSCYGTKAYYINDQLNGIYEKYKVQDTNQWINSKVNTNILIAKGQYVKGLKQGKWFEYGEDDGIGQEGEYRNDIRIGKWISTYYDSKPLTKKGYYTIYENGNVVGCYNQNGQDINALKKVDDEWENVFTAQDYESFIKKYPNDSRVSEARKKIPILKKQELLNTFLTSGDVKHLEELYELDSTGYIGEEKYPIRKLYKDVEVFTCEKCTNTSSFYIPSECISLASFLCKNYIGSDFLTVYIEEQKKRYRYKIPFHINYTQRSGVMLDTLSIYDGKNLIFQGFLKDREDWEYAVIAFDEEKYQMSIMQQKWFTVPQSAAQLSSFWNNGEKEKSIEQGIGTIIFNQHYNKHIDKDEYENILYNTTIEALLVQQPKYLQKLSLLLENTPQTTRIIELRGLVYWVLEQKDEALTIFKTKENEQVYSSTAKKVIPFKKEILETYNTLKNANVIFPEEDYMIKNIRKLK